MQGNIITVDYAETNGYLKHYSIVYDEKPNSFDDNSLLYVKTIRAKIEFDKGMGSASGASAGSANNRQQGSSKKKLPKKDAQLKHIFRKKKGHLDDTVENRTLLERVANKLENYMGEDKHGNEWYSETLSDGRQVWVQVRGNTIQNGGVNNPPLKWNVGTGFSKP